MNKRKVFHHILVQDLECGDIALVKSLASVFTQLENKLIRVDSTYLTQGQWEICGFDLAEERTVLARYQHNELIPVACNG